MTLSVDPDQRSVTEVRRAARGRASTYGDRRVAKNGSGGACENRERDSTRMEMPRARYCMEMRASRAVGATTVTKRPRSGLCLPAS